MKSARSDGGRCASPAEDDEDDGVAQDVADVLTDFWEERLKIWRSDDDSDTQTNTADKVCYRRNYSCC